MRGYEGVGLKRMIAVLVALVGLLVLAAPAAGKTYAVTKKGDPAPGPCKPRDCSLREAVRAANNHSGADRILLPARRGSYKLAIKTPLSGEDLAASGDLDILNDPLRIEHSGKGRAKVDANEIDRVFDVFEDASTTFRKIVVTGGANESGTQGGGGIHSLSRLTLVRSAVIANEAAIYGGGLLVDGGTGVRIIRSTIARNTSDSAGGMEIGPQTKIIRSKIIGNTATDTTGGAMYLYASDGKDALIDRTTIAGNTAEGDGGGVEYAGLGDSKLVVKRSTISGNRAHKTNGLFGGRGGGIFHNFGILQMTNSTVAGNISEGIGGGIYGHDDTELNAVTVVRNETGSDTVGGGLAGNESSHFVVRNSLIALNRVAGGGASDCNADEGDGTFDSAGHNLLSTDASCLGFDRPSDIVDAEPKLGQLRNNGGPTKTVALRRGSRAIGKASKQSSPNRDQRNTKRDDRPDIGAYER